MILYFKVFVNFPDFFEIYYTQSIVQYDILRKAILWQHAARKWTANLCLINARK